MIHVDPHTPRPIVAASIATPCIDTGARVADSPSKPPLRGRRAATPDVLPTGTSCKPRVMCRGSHTVVHLDGRAPADPHECGRRAAPPPPENAAHRGAQKSSWAAAHAVARDDIIVGQSDVQRGANPVPAALPQNLALPPIRPSHEARNLRSSLWRPRY